MSQRKKIDLKNEAISSLFWKYSLPSIAMMLIMAIYFIVDAMFVGRGVGSEALAAVNLCIPALMVVNGVTMALSIGASIVISIRLSQKKYDQANNVFSVLFGINTCLAILLMLAGIFWSEPLAYFLGANQDTIFYVRDYLAVILFFMPFFTLQNTFSNVVRNDGNPNLALIASLTSSLANIPLDYFLIFVLGWGIKGAALATGFSQVLATSVLISHFIFKKGKIKFVKPTFDAPLLKQKLKNSLPILVANISMPAILFTMNSLSEKYYGTLGLSAFAILGSISMFVIMIFLGIAQGIQPIVSYNYGLKNRIRTQETLKTGLFYATGIGLLLILIIWFFPTKIVNLYIYDNLRLFNFTIQALRFYLPGYLFIGLNLMFISFFQAIEKRKIALTISLLRGIILLFLMSIFIPWLFGKTGIWFVIMASEAITLVLALSFYWQEQKKPQTQNSVSLDC